MILYMGRGPPPAGDLGAAAGPPSTDYYYY